MVGVVGLMASWARALRLLPLDVRPSVDGACGSRLARGHTLDIGEMVKYCTKEVLHPAREMLHVSSMLCERSEVVQGLMARTQVFNVVIITSLNRKVFKMRKDKGRGSRIWLICCSNELAEVLKLSCRSVEGQQALVFIMEASSESKF